MNGKRLSECGTTGFTLIEIALTILVMALGILAMFSLLGSGLDTSNKASADAQAAIFADSVFSSLRVESLRAAEAEQNNAHPGSWTNFWFAFENGVTNIPVAFSELWESNMAVRCNGFQTAVFTDEQSHIVNHALRYNISITPRPYIVDVLLKVWNGQFATNIDANAMVFYTEYRKEGDL